MSIYKSIIEINKLITYRDSVIKNIKLAEEILRLISEKERVYISSNSTSGLTITERMKDYLIDGILNEMEYLESHQKNIDSKLESIGLFMGINE